MFVKIQVMLVLFLTASMGVSQQTRSYRDVEITMLAGTALCWEKSQGHLP